MRQSKFGSMIASISSSAIHGNSIYASGFKNG